MDTSLSFPPFLQRGTTPLKFCLLFNRSSLKNKEKNLLLTPKPSLAIKINTDVEKYNKDFD